MKDAVVTVEPGHRSVLTDSTGSFSFPGLKAGRYLIRVRALGFQGVRDSVTNSAAGLEVLAVLASDPIADYECVVPVRPNQSSGSERVGR